jgi:hypothetical protein
MKDVCGAAFVLLTRMGLHGNLEGAFEVRHKSLTKMRKIVGNVSAKLLWKSLLALPAVRAKKHDGFPDYPRNCLHATLSRHLSRRVLKASGSTTLSRIPRKWFVICELAGQCASVRGSQAGTVEIFLDGVSAGKIGETATERVPGIGAEADLVGDFFAIVSNVWAGPWTEELPKDHPGTQFTLVNGDVVDGVIKGLHERKLDIARDPGPLDLWLDQVQCIDFSGATAAQPAVARLRLADGSAINLDRCCYATTKYTAERSETDDRRERRERRIKRHEKVETYQLAWYSY